MVSVYVLVLGNKKLVRPESSTAAPMAHHRAGAFNGGRPAAARALLDLNRSIEDQRPRKKDTPSLRIFVKSPWRFRYSTRSP